MQTTHKLLLTTQLGGGAHISYDADAAIWFNRVPSYPSALRRQIVNDYIVAAKDNGWFFEHDAISIMAIGLDDPGSTTPDDAAAAKMNLRQAAYDLIAFSSPTFTTDRGFQGDAAAAYLSSGFNPTTAVTPNFTRNDANFAAWSRTAATGVPSDAGYYGGADGTTLQFRDASDNSTGRLNQASVLAQTGAPSGLGLMEVDRSAASGAGSIIMRKAGVVVSTNTDNVASTALLNAALQYLRYGTGSYSARQLAAGFIGGHLTPTQALARYNDTLTYMQAVGAVA